MFVCEGLIGESVMAVCEFYELDYECRRGGSGQLLVSGNQNVRPYDGLAHI